LEPSYRSIDGPQANLKEVRGVHPRSILLVLASTPRDGPLLKLTRADDRGFSAGVFVRNVPIAYVGDDFRSANAAV
jgi:hypothetical protein